MNLKEDLLLKAYTLAKKWHLDQVDKGGNPYILHVKHVSEQMSTLDAKVVGMLHDIVEDTPLTLEDLVVEGFTPIQVAAIDAMTRREGESYDHFIYRVVQNPLAKAVKREDILHNSRLDRLPESMRAGATSRVKRYKKFLSVLEDNEGIWHYSHPEADPTHGKWVKN